MQTSDAFSAQTNNDLNTSQLLNVNFLDNDDGTRISERSVRIRNSDGSASSSSSVVDFNPNFGGQGDYSNPRGGKASMAFLADKFHDIFKSVEPLIQEMASDFVGYFVGEISTSSRRYIADVFLPHDMSKIGKLVEILRECGGARRKGLFGFSCEDDHIHIIHDCSWGGSHCRCVYQEKIKPYGIFNRPRKHVKRIFEFTKIEFYDVFQYYFMSKQGIRGLWINGTSRGLPTDGKLTLYLYNFY
jgi:hypothetical protein